MLGHFRAMLTPLSFFLFCFVNVIAQVETNNILYKNNVERTTNLLHAEKSAFILERQSMYQDCKLFTLYQKQKSYDANHNKVFYVNQISKIDFIDRFKFAKKIQICNNMQHKLFECHSFIKSNYLYSNQLSTNLFLYLPLHFT